VCLSHEQCSGSLKLLAQLNNSLMQTSLQLEYPLIEKELRIIDYQLKEAEVCMCQVMTTCWDRIKQVKKSVCDLEQRVQ